ncbi:thymocyte nuclear protein 1-like [Antedon mediterranea]|uniref:thymocyte nuclear protein 1-like n=1 Tax=Antedon mediterranea TaxID=105859 RepID=UPI003AF40B87
MARDRKTARKSKAKKEVNGSPEAGESAAKKSKVAEKKEENSTYTRWLMKSEPDSRIENGIDVKFGIEDLKKETNQTACWDGVRNYQARNFMRDKMKKGHKAFFYHSNCKVPGIAGIIEIVKEGYADHTQFDKKELHFDSSSKVDKPKWFMVDVKFVRMTKRFISLPELKTIHLKHKTEGGPLANVSLFTKARLSVMPLTEAEYDFILELENTDPVDKSCTPETTPSDT